MYWFVSREPQNVQELQGFLGVVGLYRLRILDDRFLVMPLYEAQEETMSVDIRVPKCLMRTAKSINGSTCITAF